MKYPNNNVYYKLYFLIIIFFVMFFFYENNLSLKSKSRIFTENKSLDKNSNNIHYEKTILNITKTNKVCICTVGKKENLYAREYVNFYKNLGIDKIFIYDNNDKNDEKFDLVLKDYINDNFVEIIDIRGKIAPQINSFEDCRKKNFKMYDWLIFFDMDEFLFLRNYSNIKQFLNQKTFDKCERIQLNWFVHTDNNLLNYDNRTLIKRFPDKRKEFNGTRLPGSNMIKSILKGYIDIEINDHHYLNPNLIVCNGFGKIIKFSGGKTNETDHFYYYIDHYWSKSTEEFVDKLMRGDAILGNKNKQNNLNRINMYFKYNNITLEKINYIESRTKYNLNNYKLFINK